MKMTSPEWCVLTKNCLCSLLHHPRIYREGCANYSAGANDVVDELPSNLAEEFWVFNKISERFNNFTFSVLAFSGVESRKLGREINGAGRGALGLSLPGMRPTV
jgi:hypothetical protein